MKPFVILAALAAFTSSAAAQGSLTPPPGAPAPVMRTLDQVEARTPIPATVTPGPGPHFTISQPGSYYLTGNITVTSGDGIRITAASDVSIDLNGFTIRSTLSGSSNGGGIRSDNSLSNLAVSNGSIVSSNVGQGFSLGIASSFGSLSNAKTSNVHVRGVASNGIYLDLRGIVENCHATSCGSNGIIATSGTVRNSVATSNGNHGIVATNATVIGCIASFNDFDGIKAEGGVVTGCHAQGNVQNGINVGVGVVSQCVATANDTAGSPSYYQIKVLSGGQRVTCVPATEAGSP